MEAGGIIYGPRNVKLPPNESSSRDSTDSPTTASHAPSDSNLNNLPLELTINDLAGVLNTTPSALRHRTERGDTKNGRLPKEIRRRRNQPYLWNPLCL